MTATILWRQVEPLQGPVYQKQIAQDVTASQQSLALDRCFQIQVTARPVATADELERRSTTSSTRFRTTAPDQAEVERAQQVRYAFDRRAAEAGGFRRAWPIG